MQTPLAALKLTGAIAIAARRSAPAPESRRRARATREDLRVPPDVRLGDQSGIHLLDFQLRAVPGEVTLIDFPESNRHREAARDFLFQWVLGLAKQADWRFEVRSRGLPEAVLGRLQGFCQSAHEVPWLLEHFSCVDSREAETPRGPVRRASGVLWIDGAEVRADEVRLLMRQARQSGVHYWLTREMVREQELTEIQNVCDNHVRVWNEKAPHGVLFEASRTKVKVCSVRNWSAGRALTSTFDL